MLSLPITKFALIVAVAAASFFLNLTHYNVKPFITKMIKLQNIFPILGPNHMG